MSKSRVRSFRGTVEIIEPSEEEFIPLSPPPIKQPMEVDSIILSAFSIPPHNSDKALALQLLLTSVEGIPLSITQQNEIIFLLKNAPKTLENIDRLLKYLNVLFNKGQNIPPYQFELIKTYMPVSLVEPLELDLKKSYLLRLLLIRIEPYPLTPEETIKILDILKKLSPSDVNILGYPSPSDDDIQELKTLLYRLKTNITSLPPKIQKLILKNFPISLIGQEEINQLKMLRYPNNEPIVSLQDPSTLYEIINLLIYLGFDKTYSFLQRVSHPTSIIFDSALMNPIHEKYFLDLDILKTKVKVTQGVTPCPRCGSREVIYVEVQTRSADEPMTVKFTCISCGKKWNI